MKNLNQLPEFKALQTVLTAMARLKPEGRRRVIEAVHALLEVSAGRKPAHGFQGPGQMKPKLKKRR